MEKTTWWCEQSHHEFRLYNGDDHRCPFCGNAELEARQYGIPATFWAGPEEDHGKVVRWYDDDHNRLVVALGNVRVCGKIVHGRNPRTAAFEYTRLAELGKGEVVSVAKYDDFVVSKNGCPFGSACPGQCVRGDDDQPIVHPDRRGKCI